MLKLARAQKKLKIKFDTPHPHEYKTASFDGLQKSSSALKTENEREIKQKCEPKRLGICRENGISSVKTNNQFIAQAIVRKNKRSNWRV